MSSLNILSLQPFYGGSHRAFVDGWSKNSRHKWTTFSLPDRHWKWRMRHSAIYFQDALKQTESNNCDWDLIVCTDMLNVAEFRGLMDSRLATIPIVVYFHENQFAYPQLSPQPRDLHFAFTNLTSALAATEVWFNSEFNRDSMVSEYSKVRKSWPDFRPKNLVEQLLDKSQIQRPGIDLPCLDARKPKSSDEPLHLVWAARWEHDKNPEALFAALCQIDDRMDYKLSILGKSFTNVPKAIEKIKSRFAHRIANWGFQSTQTSYFNILLGGDVFISTADHEFFGLAAAEGIAAGLYPLFPNRVAYPELLSIDQFGINKNLLYGQTAEQLAEKLLDLDQSKLHEWRIQSQPFTENFRATFGWKTRASEMDEALDRIVAG